MKKRIEKTKSCDIYIVGAGIAGIVAAIEASDMQNKVILSSSANIFSGSSFYPGTWGLGVVTPESKEDEEDLIQTILKVGSHVAKEELVETFVKNMRPTLFWLKNLGVSLLEAKDKKQKDFIPCFDHKHRNWNGIVAIEAKETFKRLLLERKVELAPFCELVDIVTEDEKLKGVILQNKEGTLEFIQCKALILATGGFGGLYEKHLTTNDIQGIGQYLALQHGASLINMEFMQMMPGMVSPCKNVIFNEKTFRYVESFQECDEKLLEQRGTYGPFTSRLPSREIDFFIENAGQDGVKVTYNDDLKKNMPEFIQTYFQWLENEKGLTIEDSMWISMFAHAANGGIEIFPDASTKIPGVFACGEVTGGMHGADRIGGLSTVNGFVFGRIAGQSACNYAKDFLEEESLLEIEFEIWGVENREKLEKELIAILSQYAFLIRSKEGLEEGLVKLRAMQRSIKKYQTQDLDESVKSRKLIGHMELAEGIMKAQMLRKESRGSHFRKDYPEENEKYAQNIRIQKKEDQVSVGWND